MGKLYSPEATIWRRGSRLTMAKSYPMWPASDGLEMIRAQQSFWARLVIVQMSLAMAVLSTASSLVSKQLLTSVAE